MIKKLFVLLSSFYIPYAVTAAASSSTDPGTTSAPERHISSLAEKCRAAIVQHPHFADALLPVLQDKNFPPDEGKSLIAARINNGLVKRISPQYLHTLQGHTAEVRSAAWSPDGSCIASASEDRTVRIWDATRLRQDSVGQAGEYLHTLQGHTAMVSSTAWSPDCSRIATASGDCTVRIWDAYRGECLHTLQGHPRPVRSAAWSPDGSRIASASDDRTVRMWDAHTGKCLHVLRGHTDVVLSARKATLINGENLWNSK